MATWVSVCGSDLEGSGGKRGRHGWCPCRVRVHDPPILGHALSLYLGLQNDPGRAGVDDPVRDPWGNVDVHVHGEDEREVGVGGNVGDTGSHARALSPSPEGDFHGL